MTDKLKQMTPEEREKWFDLIDNLLCPLPDEEYKAQYPPISAQKVGEKNEKES